MKYTHIKAINYAWCHEINKENLAVCNADVTAWCVEEYKDMHIKTQEQFSMCYSNKRKTDRQTDRYIIRYKYTYYNINKQDFYLQTKHKELDL